MEAFILKNKSVTRHEFALPRTLLTEWLNTFGPSDRERYSKIVMEVLPSYNFDLDLMKGHKDYHLAVCLTRQFMDFFHHKLQDRLPSGHTLCAYSVRRLQS